jgi:hypothetical protein
MKTFFKIRRGGVELWVTDVPLVFLLRTQDHKFYNIHNFGLKLESKIGKQPDTKMSFEWFDIDWLNCYKKTYFTTNEDGVLKSLHCLIPYFQPFVVEGGRRHEVLDWKEVFVDEVDDVVEVPQAFTLYRIEDGWIKTSFKKDCQLPTVVELKGIVL